MADPKLDPRLVQQIDDAMDAVKDVIEQARRDAAAKRQRANIERDALAQQLFDLADQGRALVRRWDVIAARRAEGTA